MIYFQIVTDSIMLDKSIICVLSNSYKAKTLQSFHTF